MSELARTTEKSTKNHFENASKVTLRSRLNLGSFGGPFWGPKSTRNYCTEGKNRVEK